MRCDRPILYGKNSGPQSSPTEWRRVSRGTRVSLLTPVQLTQDQIGISATSLPQIRYSNVRSKLKEMT